MLPWALPAVGLACLTLVAGAAVVPAACATGLRVAASTAGVPAVSTVTLPKITIRPLGQPRPLLGTRSKSPNWSGYDVTGGPFTSVTASWRQPRVPASSSFLTDAAFWVGLDGDTPDPGADPPQTVEQIGTEGYSMQGRVYYDAWYEMYPAPPTSSPARSWPSTPATGSRPASPGLRPRRPAAPPRRRRRSSP